MLVCLGVAPKDTTVSAEREDSSIVASIDCSSRTTSKISIHDHATAIVLTAAEDPVTGRRQQPRCGISSIGQHQRPPRTRSSTARSVLTICCAPGCRRIAHTPLLQVKVHPTLASETAHSTVASETRNHQTTQASLAKVEGLDLIVHRRDITDRFDFLI